MRSTSKMSKAFLGGGFVLFLTFVLVSHAAAQTCVQPPSGLVHWWPGDGDAMDIVGGSTGTLAGGASFVTGLVVQAFGFDGLNGSVATPVILPPVGTIELWVNPSSLDSPSSTQILTGTHGTANGDDRLWIVSVGSGGGPGVAPNTFVVNVGSCCVNDLVLLTNPLSVGTWTHIALTFDYTLGVYHLYVDGVLEASATVPRNAPTQALRLGGATSDFGQNFFFHGAVDEVSVYGRVLAASEIQAIVSAGSAGKCKDEDGDGFRPPQDCDETNPLINPNAVELPGNFIDENCDGNLGACDPCATWKNHGEYVRCVAHDVEALVIGGRITEDPGDTLVASAAGSNIGKKGFVPPECQ